ncbi:hypothetical protein F4774DRAFT_392553, partial [Daldinia eschscholtzii]
MKRWYIFKWRNLFKTLPLFKMDEAFARRQSTKLNLEDTLYYSGTLSQDSHQSTILRLLKMMITKPFLFCGHTLVLHGCLRPFIL